MSLTRLKDKIDKTGNSLDRLRTIIKEFMDSVQFFPDENSLYSTNLTFEKNRNIAVVGSGTPVFTADLTNAKVGIVVALSIEANQLTNVDFTDEIFEVRRNDFNAAVDCVIYCSYEFGKVAVSILPKVQV